MSQMRLMSLFDPFNARLGEAFAVVTHDVLVLLLDRSDKVEDDVAGWEMAPALAPVLIKGRLSEIIGSVDFNVHGSKSLRTAHTALLDSAVDHFGHNKFIRPNVGGTHPTLDRVWGVGQGRVKTVKMETALAIVTTDDGPYRFSRATTLGAEDGTPVFKELQEFRIIVFQSRRVFGRELSQPGEVRHGGVVALSEIRSAASECFELSNADESLLGLLGGAVFEFEWVLSRSTGCLDSIGNFRVRPFGITSAAVPLPFRRVFWIHARSDTIEVKGVLTSVAAEQLARAIAVVAVVHVLEWLAVIRVSMCT